MRKEHTAKSRLKARGCQATGANHSHLISLAASITDRQAGRTWARTNNEKELLLKLCESYDTDTATVSSEPSSSESDS